MMNEPNAKPNVVLGIDISKEWIDAHLLPSGQSWRVGANPDELAAWIDELPADIELVVLEATGGLEAAIIPLFQKAGLPVAMANPRRVRNFARAVGKLAKTDSIDAGVIARFGTVVESKILPGADETRQRLRQLAARRRQLRNALATEKNRLAAKPVPEVRADIECHIAWLERQIAALEKKTMELVREHPVWGGQAELMTSVPGVGEITAVTLLADMPELGTLGRGAAAALAGVAPFAKQSGKGESESRIAGGRSTVRCALYMAALSAMRHNPAIRPFAQRLERAGKKRKKIIVACMRKLIIILNAILRDNAPWNFREENA